MKNICYIFFTWLLTLSTCLYATEPALPIKLSCEYLQNPLGIDITQPRLSWNLSSVQRGDYQTGYEIMVSSAQNADRILLGDCWTTGKINSTQSLHIIYEGKPLQPFTKYYWRVKWYDKNGVASAWSAAASFETAALKQHHFSAKWIGDGSKQFIKDEDFYQYDPMPLFRKQININKKIATARMYISGLGYSEVFINDKKLGDHMLDPGFTAYRKQALYVTYDITQLLTGQSLNTIGIMLGNGWFNPLPLRLFGQYNLRNVQQTARPCVKAQVLIKYTDGSTETIVTNDSWQTAPGPVTRNNVFLGEEYDARLEKKFTEKIGWKNAAIVSGPAGELSAQLQPPIRVTKIIKPIAIKEVGKDSFVVDMGQNFAGVARIKVKGPAGVTVSLRYAEIAHPNGSINWITTTAGHIKEIWNLNGGPGAPKTAWQKDCYTLKGVGMETWNPRFTFHAFRYIEITGWPGKPPTLDDIEGLRMNTDLIQEGNFECANPMFNTLHDKIQWTFLSNVFSVQSDCPGREKMGYGADIAATASAYMHNYNMANFYKKTVQDFANDQQPDGGLTEIAPYTGIADRGYGGESGPLGWQLAFCYLQKKLYDQYGDKKIIETQYPVFKKQMDFLQHKAIQGLFHWDIGDHEAIDPRAEAFSAACFYYHHALLATEFAGILGIKEDAEKYGRLANSIKDNIVRKYLVPNTGRFDNATQAAQLFALWYKISPEIDKTFEVLMQEFSRHNNHLSTGIYSTMMLFDVLREKDRNDIAYTIANQKGYPGWGYMLANDATTLWESWSKPESSSYNHPMFGSIDEWFYKSLLGINAAAPGYKKIIIKPQPVSLLWAKGSYESVYGIIESDWKKEADKFQLRVTIPVNTSAEIWLPANEKNKISESGDSHFYTNDISFQKYEKGYAVIKVGAGSYHFLVY
ncbi:MAG: alpha-L-rhamnosidase [Sphingobacteriia bacterium]|nr:MAG: alpha-L-rhamnosidase [Sphingobacteriia bacterium]TAG31084.1 MAG: alpha-L-rhamnosidase [Sphingobacteriia bacterium]TAH08384.1 MAG: alpha-L-rhamnosidase [Sphingobacteriia bacterium]